MKQIAHTPPKPPLPTRRREPTVELCSSGGRPINEQGECACCTD